MGKLLEGYGVRVSFQSRVIAVLGEEPPKPPQAVLDGQLSNEYFAYFVLDAQNLKYTVRNAYELIGGGFNKVAENVRRVKLHLPLKEEPSKGVDALTALKAEIRADERRLLNIELQEQEDFYVDKMAKLDELHHKKHDNIIASNASLTTENDMLVKHNKALKEQLLELQSRERELNNSYSQVQSELRGSTAKLVGLQALITEKNTSTQVLQVANAQTISAYSSKLKAIGSELDEYRITNRKLINEVSAQREALLAGSLKLSDTSQRLEQQNLILNEQRTITSISKAVDESLTVLTPISDLVKDLMEAKKAGAINVKSITTAIHSVDGKVADINGRMNAVDQQVQQILNILTQDPNE